jgi:hypothetical protein
VQLLQLHLEVHVHLLLLLLLGACASPPRLHSRVMQQQRRLAGRLSAAGPLCAAPSCRWGPRAWWRCGPTPAQQPLCEIVLYTVVLSVVLVVVR